ncbi:MAG: hypothetical protein WA006_10320, partial [Rhodoglobus sp.]
MLSTRISARTHQARHVRSGPPDPQAHIPKWRRWLAASAVSALAFTGVGVLGLAPASAEEVAPVACIEPQVLDVDGVTCVDPAPVEEVVEETTECVEPQVLGDDGVTCVDPAPVEEVVEEATECVEPQVLDIDGVTCV